MLARICILLSMAAACSACATSTWTRVCGDETRFTRVSPYMMWPLPSCASNIGLTFRLYCAGSGSRGTPITRWNIPKQFRKGKRTIFLVHGSKISGTAWLKGATKAFLKKENVNVIVVTWNFADKTYAQAAADMRAVGRELQYVANNLMIKNKVTRKQIWCIGHGLGAHACGIATQVVPLGRITGLDPTGELFENNPKAGLQRIDADFVDIIHTDGAGHGMRRAIGDVDFYPNGGRQQPACARKRKNAVHMCNHRHAVKYFTRTIYQQRECCTRTHCGSYSDIPRTCKLQKPQIMGYSSDTKSGRGIYYLKTARSIPYC